MYINLLDAKTLCISFWKIKVLLVKVDDIVKSLNVFQDIVAEVDPNSIGSFKFPNFLAMMARKLDENSAEDEIRESFKVFDNVSFEREKSIFHKNIFQDGNGFINRQELGYVMENLGENLPKEEIECLINEIDIDGDGQINYEEFYTMMSSKS